MIKMKDRIQKLIIELSPGKKSSFNQIRIQIQNERWKLDRQSDDTKRSIVNPKVRERDNKKCCFCGNDVFEVCKKVGGGNTIHHIHPMRYGGKHIESNLITICAYCHQRLEKYISIVDSEAIKKTLIFVKNKLKIINSL